MALSLDPRHLGRYATIGRLLLKHRGQARDALAADGLPVEDDTATAEDAVHLVEELESMGPTFVKLG